MMMKEEVFMIGMWISRWGGRRESHIPRHDYNTMTIMIELTNNRRIEYYRSIIEWNNHFHRIGGGPTKVPSRTVQAKMKETV